MSHELEIKNGAAQMFYVANNEMGQPDKRLVPWHGLGTPVPEALTSKEALEKAGLNWLVLSEEIRAQDKVVSGYKANIRDNDGKVLGIVTDTYKIVQNWEAFAFTDALIGAGVKYETAGSLRDGKAVWMLAKLPESYKILGDAFVPYVVFTNAHDGTGAVRVAMTPIRVVCNNTLNWALRNATRSWSTKHIGDMTAKLSEAERTLGLASKYMDCLGMEAEELANTPISNDEINKILDEMFPIENDMSERQIKRIGEVKDQILVCYAAPDIAKYAGTQYGFLNAVSDWAGHAEPARKTKSYAENNWGRIIYGHPVLDKAYALVKAGT